jgi:hypothetical protein
MAPVEAEAMVQGGLERHCAEMLMSKLEYKVNPDCRKIMYDGSLTVALELL